MAIDTTKTAFDLKLKLPVSVKSGTHLLSTGNETDSLCQEKAITINEPANEITVHVPARSLNTYIFMIDNGSAAITNVEHKDAEGPKTYYDLRGRRLLTPCGLCIERSADGSSRKVIMGR